MYKLIYLISIFQLYQCIQKFFRYYEYQVSPIFMLLGVTLEWNKLYLKVCILFSTNHWKVCLIIIITIIMTTATTTTDLFKTVCLNKLCRFGCFRIFAMLSAIWNIRTHLCVCVCVCLYISSQEVKLQTSQSFFILAAFQDMVSSPDKKINKPEATSACLPLPTTIPWMI